MEFFIYSPFAISKRNGTIFLSLQLLLIVPQPKISRHFVCSLEQQDGGEASFSQLDIKDIQISRWNQMLES